MIIYYCFGETLFLGFSHTIYIYLPITYHILGGTPDAAFCWRFENRGPTVTPCIKLVCFCVLDRKLPD